MSSNELRKGKKKGEKFWPFISISISKSTLWIPHVKIIWYARMVKGKLEKGAFYSLPQRPCGVGVCFLISE